MSNNQQINYTTKPIELPLSTEKEYVLVDVIGWEMSYLDNSQYTELMKVPFSFSRVTDKAAYIDGNFGVNISDFEEYRFLEEVIRQPQTNEFNTDSIAVTEQEEEEFNAMANNSEIPNSLEWKNGDACSYYYWEGKEWRDGVYVIQDNGFHVIRDLEDDGYTGATKKHLRKPETTEQREDRERLEAAYDLYCLRCDAIKWSAKYSFDEFQKEKDAVNGWLAVVDKTNYRLKK